GAGVESVFLTQFKAANEMGRPENRMMELVPADLNRATPSFCLFHYANPDDPQPVETLGIIDWAITETHKSQDEQRVVFSADVPGQDLRIEKIYTLRPEDYHVGLAIKVKPLGKSKNPIKFRYQLAGAHGLPIEGIWYTSTFRNSLIGLEGDQNSFYRNFQDS